MKKRYILVLIFLIQSFTFENSKAQYIPIQIYDLIVVTDSLNEDYLFFRIQEDLKNSDYFKRNIYQLNVESGTEKLFLEDYFDRRFGFEYSVGILAFELINNDPNNFINVTIYCDNECSEYIQIPDSSDIFGGLFVTIDNLNVETGKDSGLVYVKAYGETVIGRNGGKDWPDANENNGFEIPDRSKVNFPLRSLSPYNDSLMFGLDSFFEVDSNAFYRSIDQGLTLESLSDTLLPEAYGYDSNQNTIYIIDRINAPGNTCTFETCKYGLYKNDFEGSLGNWEKQNIFETQLSLKVHPTISGTIYVWNKDSVAISMDFGETFTTLVNPEEEVTGFTVSANNEYFSTTYNLYKIEHGNSVQLRSIPISNEETVKIPVEFELLQNYPNPFNPSTTIIYKMDRSGIVELKLYDITGRLVREIIDEFKPAGNYSIELNAKNLSSGTYILRGKLGNEIEIQKITLIK
tara:strand:- start:3803 stop:5185 length:1383 start_codon:yes stop_codon:yes gene_type:complete